MKIFKILLSLSLREFRAGEAGGSSDGKKVSSASRVRFAGACGWFAPLEKCGRHGLPAGC